MQVKQLHFTQAESTMELARREALDLDFLLVTADTQTRGRGTKGRPWHSPAGNAYLTVAVHRKFLTPLRLKLFPLEAGLVLWESAAAFVSPDRRSHLRLKWPNDLLWERRKAAGMLLESAGNHMLIGAGINIAEAPPVSDGGTPSASLAEAGASSGCAHQLAEEFFKRIQARLVREESEDILSEWKAKAPWDVPFLLRDRAGRPPVMPVEVNAEGHLRVRFEDGREEWLVSEYLA